MKSDYQEWLDLWKWVSENKVPQGEYCFLGRRCGDKHGRNSFYVNGNGFTIDKSRDDSNLVDYQIEINSDFGYPSKPIVIFNFDWRSVHAMLTNQVQTVDELAALYAERLNLMDTHTTCEQMKNVMQEYLDDTEAIEEEKRQKLIEQKKKELAQLEA